MQSLLKHWSASFLPIDLMYYSQKSLLIFAYHCGRDFHAFLKMIYSLIYLNPQPGTKMLSNSFQDSRLNV